MPGAVHLDVELLRDKARTVAASLSVGLGKVPSRFVADMLAGLLLSGSVRLSEIARALGEPIPEHSTHKRLSRNLGNPQVGRVVARNLLAAAADLIDEDTLLFVDAFALVKPYAEKMEYLATPTVAGVPSADAASTERKGYGVCEIVSWNLGGGPLPSYAELARSTPAEDQGAMRRVSAWNDLVFCPVAQTLWSAEAPDFRSATDHIIALIRTVSTACAGRGVLLVDATGHPRLPAAMTGLPCRYVARVAADFPLLHRRRETTAAAVARECSTPYGTSIYKPQTDIDLGGFLHFGFAPVRLPGHLDQPLSLAPVKSGFEAVGAWPSLYLLTTEPMRRSREVLWRPVWSFLNYGDAVATNQDVKRQFDFDDVRVLSYQRLRNLATLVQAAAFVEALWPGIALRKSIMLKPRTGAAVVFPAPGDIVGSRRRTE